MGLSKSLNRLGFTNKVGKYLKIFKMKKTISIFSVVFLLSLTFLFSCDRNEENNEKQLQINNISTLKATAKTSSKSIFNPLGVIICRKIYWLDIGQDTEIQYLDVVKQTNIYVKYSEKLF